MPMLTRECLALKFRQNWMARHPVDPPVAQVQPLDDSLTSLSWLQNLNIMKMASPTPPSSPTPPETPSTSSQISLSQQSMPLTINPMDLRVNPNAVLNMTNLPTVKTDSSMFRSMGGVEVHPPQTNSPGVVDKIDYKTNPYVKPPYSYATLICMAMKESKKNKITLAGIYNWITDNFMYYRVADPSWQNSIRHNLSLNKCFQKVPRRKDEPGKGGFWRINPEYSDMFVNGIFKKRRNSARENIAPVPMKRARRDDDVSCENPAKQFRGMQIKTEPQEDRILHLNDEFSDTLTGDFNWSAILHQDIEVGGVSVKTEDLIDTHEDSVSDIASPITALSPPPSDSNSDVALEDLFVTDQDAALDLSSSVDLTVQGFTIKPPDWWSESMTRGLLSPMENHSSNSGLNTPISASPVPDHHPISHPWAEDRTDLDEAIASFDLDLQNLFEEDSLISNPSCLLDS